MLDLLASGIGASILVAAFAELMIPDTDTAICFVVSGSPKDEFEGLKGEVMDMATMLDTLATTTGMGMVAFGDWRWRNPSWLVRRVKSQAEGAMV